MADNNPTSTSNSPRWGARRFVLLTALVATLATIGGVALLINIFQRRQEGRNPFYRVVELTDETEDPAVWGKNFPLQYDDYKRTVDQTRTRYGGSEALPRTPTNFDPRSVVSQSKIEEDPRLKVMWAGYAFARDFREERGHAFMLEDQTYTERQLATKQPGACMHCHASVYLPYKKLGGGDLIKGFEAMNQMPYAEARKLVTHPVACIDCHDPQSMQLRVTRPGFIEGIRAFKASQGVQNYDVNAMATRQEMRSFVCGQCHVEYYFKGPEKRLVYPWSKGLKVEQIMAYYGSYNRPIKTKDSESDLRLFALHYHDGRRVLKTDNRPQALRAADGDNIRVTTRRSMSLEFAEAESPREFIPTGATRGSLSSSCRGDFRFGVCFKA
jgi:nitrite reductase (cytochrome c-552)